MEIVFSLYQSGSGAAPGDSGGPAIIYINGKPILVGASSWGLTPKDQKPTIYTNIKNYANWIKDNSGVNFFLSEIQGLAQICDIPQTYTIPNLPTGATVTWSISPTSGVASLSTSGNTATLTKTGNGSVSLNAVIHSPCGDINLPTYNVYVGLPSLPSFSSYPNARCDNQTYVLTPNLSVGITVTSITGLLDGNEVPLQQVSSGYEVPVGIYRITVTLQNSCGSVTFSKLFPRSSCSTFRVSAYPNPADTEITITHETNVDEFGKPSANSLQKQNKLFAGLYDGKGQLLKSQTLYGEKIILDTKNIPNGTYYLHINAGKATIKKQIIIKHQI